MQSFVKEFERIGLKISVFDHIDDLVLLSSMYLMENEDFSGEFELLKHFLVKNERECTAERKSLAAENFLEAAILVGKNIADRVMSLIGVDPAGTINSGTDVKFPEFLDELRILKRLENAESFLAGYGVLERHRIFEKCKALKKLVLKGSLTKRLDFDKQ